MDTNTAYKLLGDTLPSPIKCPTTTRMDSIMANFRSWSPFSPKNFKEQTSPAWGCAMTKSNKFVFSAGVSHVIYIWDFESGLKHGELTGHTNTPNFLFLVKDDTVLVSVGWDGNVNFWNWMEQTMIKSEASGSSALYSAVLNKDKTVLVVGSSTSDLIFISIDTMEVIHRTKTDGCPFGLCFNSTESEIVTGSHNQCIESFNMSDKSSTSKTKLTSGEILTLHISEDDKYMFLGTRSNLIKVYNYSDKSELHTFNTHTNWVRKMLTIDNYMISCSSDKLIKIFDMNTKQELLTVTGNEGFINNMCLSEDKQYLLTASSDGSLNVFKICSLNRVEMVKTPSPIVATVLNKSESHLLTGSGDGKIRVYDPYTLEFQKELEFHSKEIRKIRISPNDLLGASCSLDFTVVVWDLEKGEALNTFTKHTAKIHGLDFSPNSQLIASGGEDFYIYVLDTTSFELVFSVIAHTDSIFELNFQADNETLISTGADKTVRVWNVKDGKKIFNFQTGDKIIDSADLSPDQNFYVFGTRDSVIHFWNWNRKSEICTFIGGTGFINSLRFFSDSKRFVSASGGDFVLKIWNCIEQCLEVSLKGHIGTVKGIAVTSDMRTLYSSCFKNSLRKWNIGTIETLSIGNISSILDSFVFGGLLKKKEIPPDSLSKSVFTDLKINLIHYYSYLGLRKPLKKALESGVEIRIDGEMRSPLYYSIIRKSQACTDVILNYLIQLGQSNFMLFLNYANHLRGEFAMFLQDSSVYLQEFLEVLYYKVPGTVRFGVPILPLPALIYSDSRIVDESEFVKESDATNASSEEVIEFKTLPFAISDMQGSAGSIEILKSITSTSNSTILKTDIVRTYVRDKWDSMWKFIFLLTVLNWTSICIMIELVFLSHENQKKTVFFTGMSVSYFTLILIMACYEVFQAIATGLDYFCDWWNIIDIIKIVLSIVWIGLENSGESFEYYHFLTWSMVAFNFVRGLIGFRTFDKTRHYTKLIIRSLFQSIYFLLIFFYSTLTFGVLYYVSNYDSEDLERFSIIKTSYELSNGSFENSSVFSLEYFTFILASIVNVIITLNLLISILGDSFEAFQAEAIEVDTLEMAEMVLEIETMMFWRKDNQQKHFLHRCQVSEQAGMINWDGKMVYISKLIQGMRARYDESHNELKTQNSQILAKLDKLLAK